MSQNLPALSSIPGMGGVTDEELAALPPVYDMKFAGIPGVIKTPDAEQYKQYQQAMANSGAGAEAWEASKGRAAMPKTRTQRMMAGEKDPYAGLVRPWASGQPVPGQAGMGGVGQGRAGMAASPLGVGQGRAGITQMAPRAPAQMSGMGGSVYGHEPYPSSPSTPNRPALTGKPVGASKPRTGR